MNDIEKAFWEAYLTTSHMVDKGIEPPEVSIAGNQEIADKLLSLYLSGRKTAGSSLEIDYTVSGDPLPTIGNHWMILNSKGTPKCIVKTVKIVKMKFEDIPKEIAIAEGEGDLSLDYWRKEHQRFFDPFLKNWNVENLEEEIVITEFFELVFRE